VQPRQEEVEAAVREILELPSPLPTVAERKPAQEPIGPDGNPLTAREIEIVRLLARGRTNQEMADELFISLRTVQTHVSNILTKLKLSSRAAVAAFAVRHGLD
jgi:NarL family two-component system response regulator LiaR